ncbi:MAG: hypothetical protein OXE99_14305 [Cellvibrionales bacterium]|nr:hypothetical protein [Cellvibrionales bacterium]
MSNIVIFLAYLGILLPSASHSTHYTNDKPTIHTTTHLPSSPTSVNSPLQKGKTINESISVKSATNSGAPCQKNKVTNSSKKPKGEKGANPSHINPNNTFTKTCEILSSKILELTDSDSGDTAIKQQPSSSGSEAKTSNFTNTPFPIEGTNLISCLSLGVFTKFLERLRNSYLDGCCSGWSSCNACSDWSSCNACSGWSSCNTCSGWSSCNACSGWSSCNACSDLSDCIDWSGRSGRSGFDF